MVRIHGEVQVSKLITAEGKTTLCGKQFSSWLPVGQTLHQLATCRLRLHPGPCRYTVTFLNLRRPCFPTVPAGVGGTLLVTQLVWRQELLLLLFLFFSSPKTARIPPVDPVCRSGTATSLEIGLERCLFGKDLLWLSSWECVEWNWRLLGVTFGARCVLVLANS